MASKKSNVKDSGYLNTAFNIKHKIEMERQRQLLQMMEESQENDE